VRNPNTKCSVCGAGLYRQPSMLAKTNSSFCSRKCMYDSNSSYFIKLNGFKECPVCKEKTVPNRSNRKFCGLTCSSKGQRRGNERKEIGFRTRLKKLKEASGFTCCMVQGCEYNKTYDVHRNIPGSEGGMYTLDNMFAICPNHHAEHNRGIIKLFKIREFVLGELAERPNASDC
jgi:hypothetical protein